MDVTVTRGGKRYYIDFIRGKVNTPMKVIGTAPEHEHGTKVHFLPDPDIFTEIRTFDDKILTTRIRELAFLNKGLKLTFTDKRAATHEKLVFLSLIHISEPTRRLMASRMPSSA